MLFEYSSKEALQNELKFWHTVVLNMYNDSDYTGRVRLRQYSVNGSKRGRMW